MICVKSYIAILCIISFALVSVGTADASGELTDTQKLHYAISSEKMYGHLSAALDVFLNGEEHKHLASAHLGHAMINEFEASHKFLQNYPDYYSSSLQTLTEIENTDSLDKQSLDTQAKNLVKLVRKGQNMILGEKITHTEEFSLFIITSLLEAAKDSLRYSQDTTGVSQMMFIQDATGFIIRANIVLKNIENMEPKQFESTTNSFKKYFLIYDTHDKIGEQIKYLDKMIVELYYYQITQNKRFSFPEESEVATPSEQISLKIDGVPGNNIVSFTGEGFPPNSTLDISYITLDNKNPQKFKIKTTKTGYFFLPIEVNVSEKIYYVSITSQKTTTNYMLN